jgi:hypothetical protein
MPRSERCVTSTALRPARCIEPAPALRKARGSAHCPPPTSSALSNPHRKEVWRSPYRASSAPVTNQPPLSAGRQAPRLRTVDGNHDTMRSNAHQSATPPSLKLRMGTRRPGVRLICPRRLSQFL